MKRVRAYTAEEPQPVRSWPFVLFSVVAICMVLWVVSNNADKAPQRFRVFSAVAPGEGVAASIISDSTSLANLVQQLHTLHFSLPASWHLQLLCFPAACAKMTTDTSLQQLIANEHVIVTPLSQEVSVLTRSELLLSLHFWEALLHDRVILFDEQVIFCPKVQWSNFSAWDFILTPSVSLRQRNPSIVLIERWLTQHQTTMRSQTRKTHVTGMVDERLWFLDQLRSTPMRATMASPAVEQHWLGDSERTSNSSVSFAVLLGGQCSDR